MVLLPVQTSISFRPISITMIRRNSDKLPLSTEEKIITRLFMYIYYIYVPSEREINLKID